MQGTRNSHSSLLSSYQKVGSGRALVEMIEEIAKKGLKR
jgi:hypothetical protein